jgi:hypothetical protein
MLITVQGKSVVFATYKNLFGTSSERPTISKLLH